MKQEKLIELLKLKKEDLQELLCETTWNKDNIDSMYNICNMIKDIETTIKNIKLIAFEQFIEEKSKYYEYVRELEEYKRNRGDLICI